MKLPGLRRVATAMLLLTAGLAAHCVIAAQIAKSKVLGLKKVIAFTYFPTANFDVKQLHSVTLVGPVAPDAWKYWRPRHVVAAVGHGWGDLIHPPFDEAVKSLTGQDMDANPQPVVMIDEFGFDYGGNIDEKSAQVLRAAKAKKPVLSLAVFDMRGPVAQVLAEAYRDAADLVMMESYISGPQQYWFIATQAWSARYYGILPKTIFILGLGKGGNPGEIWAQTPQELEQQMRFVRLIAPESPGIGFFGGTPELLASADALSGRFFRFPTNGAGLPREAIDVAQIFNKHHEKPTLVISPFFVEPNFTADAKALAEPRMMRAYVINLGDQDAHNVKFQLRNRPKLGGDVFAAGVVPLIAARSAVVAPLRITAAWREWVGQWILEADAPGCDVLTYPADAATK